MAISLEKKSAKLLHNSFADSARRVTLQHEAAALFCFSLVFYEKAKNFFAVFVAFFFFFFLLVYILGVSLDVFEASKDNWVLSSLKSAINASVASFDYFTLLLELDAIFNLIHNSQREEKTTSFPGSEFGLKDVGSFGQKIWARHP